jgi:hypothetical protein
MAQFLNTVAFFPLALCQGTCRNAIWLKMYRRTLERFFFIKQKAERRVLPKGSAAFIPVLRIAGAFRRELVNPHDS